ncbi:MAG: hypothetical protein ACRDYZ_08825 [Acidimicrobiales bacterium]
MPILGRRHLETVLTEYVATHVSHILAKLAMTSRTDLVSAAARGRFQELGEDAEQAQPT